MMKLQNGCLDIRRRISKITGKDTLQYLIWQKIFMRKRFLTKKVFWKVLLTNNFYLAVAITVLCYGASLAQDYQNNWETRFCSDLRTGDFAWQFNSYCKGTRSVSGHLGDKIVNGYSDLELIRLAIRSGMDPSVDGNRLLYTAIASRDLPIFRVLVASGANLEKRYIGITPLIYTIMFEFSAGSRLLISAGANIEAPDDYISFGRPLHYAAGHVELDIAKRLIQSGADVNAIDRFNETALHKVVKSTEWESHEDVLKRVRMCKLLVNNGANKSLKNSNGDSATELAERHPYWGIRKCTNF